MASSSDASWLVLRSVRGVGPIVYRTIIERFGTPDRAIQASLEELTSAGIPRNTAANIIAATGFEAAERELCDMERIGARLIRWTSPEYPENLRHIADPPPYLYLRGDSTALSAPCVAIVGARAASDAGRHMARRLGRELAARGVTVVSGLARGIDGEAHQGALEAEGRTIAVMGCGIDVIYPAEHRTLAESIITARGALISELPLGTAPRSENFPARNRILSGLCLGVVVVEAAERSGSLITARMALEQDRQVFAVPGSPLSGKSRGSNRLIKEGARMVECVDDIIGDLAPQLSERPSNMPLYAKSQRTPLEQQPGITAKDAIDSEKKISYSEPIQSILSCLNKGSKLHVDAIIEKCGMNAQTVLRLLLDLELKGLVAQYPGKLFSLA
jgi:DNA processing protein